MTSRITIQDIKKPLLWGFFLVIILMSTKAYSDMNDCMKLNDQNDKNYCMAEYSGSGSFCDKIKGYERRTQCMRMVIAKQRQLQYGIKKYEKTFIKIFKDFTKNK